MASVTYHGEFPEGSDTIVQHGYEFGRDGKAVNVTEKELLAKFAANRFFKTGDSDKEAVEAGKEEADKAEAEAHRSWLAEHGVNVHHRVGLEKLRETRAEIEKSLAKAQSE